MNLKKLRREETPAAATLWFLFSTKTNNKFTGLNIKFKPFLIFLAFLFLNCTAYRAYALHGSDDAHDPSSIIKDGSKYWVFKTGNGITSMWSTDLILWHNGPSVFNVSVNGGVASGYPGWIDGAVPAFKNSSGGQFWAPECIHMNGKFYLFYAVSTFGSSTSAIGVASSNSLNSPNWTDLGRSVVTSRNNGDANAIDPALCYSGTTLYMTYGSFHGGIGLVQINQSDGSRLGTDFHWIAGNVSGSTRNGSNSEAPYIVQNGSFFYLFINKGACCRGVNSTYHVQIGRSSSITGPYVDPNGKALENDGGTDVLTTSGHYIGPGQVGLFTENGVNYLSHHYYDANQRYYDSSTGKLVYGRPKLAIWNLGWNNGWPFITGDWIAAGQYSVKNRNSNMVWDDWGCTGANAQQVNQNTSSGVICQKWHFLPDGNGEYKITTAEASGNAVEVFNNGNGNSSPLDINPYNSSKNQRWKIERTNDGSFIFTTLNGYTYLTDPQNPFTEAYEARVAEVPGCVTSTTQLKLFDYNGFNCQWWSVSVATAAVASLNSLAVGDGVSTLPIGIVEPSNTLSKSSIAYPNPAPNGKLTLNLINPDQSGVVQVNIMDWQGRNVYSKTYTNQVNIAIDANLRSGIYVIGITTNKGTEQKKIIVP